MIKYTPNTRGTLEDYPEIAGRVVRALKILDPKLTGDLGIVRKGATPERVQYNSGKGNVIIHLDRGSIVDITHRPMLTHEANELNKLKSQAIMTEIKRQHEVGEFRYWD